MKTEYFASIPVDVVTYEDITATIPAAIEENRQIRIASVNPQIVVEGRKYPRAMRYVENAQYRIPDGVGIVKASKLQHGEITERVTGIDLMYRLLEVADALEEKIFLYGAHPDVVKKCAENIEKDYPHLEVVGYIDGYTSCSDKEIVQQINHSQAMFLFVALGFPKQEEWLAEHAEELNAIVLEDVGGSFDVISGMIKRAPNWVQKCNLEWLYRTIKQPKKIKRVFQLPVFLWRVLREKEH